MLPLGTMIDGLLERIQRDPRDIEARLVYADALLERGDLRGEFIQLQCELEELDREHPRYPQVAARAQALEDAHGLRWWRPLRRIGSLGHSCSSGGPRYRSRRGFVEHVRLTARELLTHGQELVTTTPLCSVRLEEITPAEARELSRWPALARIAELSIDFGVEGPGVERDPAAILGALLDSPFLGALESLRLEGPLDARAAEVLAHCDRLGGLRQLSMEGHLHGVGPKGARALAGSASLERLETLELIGQRIGLDGLEALLDSPRSRPLRRLVLWGCHVGDGGAQALARSDQISSLHELDVSACGLSPDGARVLAAAARDRPLRALILDGNDKLAGHLDEVLGGLDPLGLHALSLQGCGLGPGDLRPLVDAATARLLELQSLELADNELGDDGIERLATSRFAALRHLDLTGNAINDDGLAALAEGAVLESIESLRLGRNEFEARGGSALASSEQLRHLRALEIDLDPDEGVLALLGSPHLDRLVELSALADPQSPSRYRLGAEVLKRLARSQTLSAVERLVISAVDDASVQAWATLPEPSSVRELTIRGGLSDQGARAIVESPTLSRLTYVTLGRCPLSLRVMELLRRRFGERLSYWDYEAPEPVLERIRAFPGP